jgi:hypothetical protein
MVTKLTMIDLAILNGYPLKDIMFKFRIYPASYYHSIKKLRKLRYIDIQNDLTKLGKNALIEHEDLYNEIKGLADNSTR